jgi:YVTN family beta-propeller protein
MKVRCLCIIAVLFTSCMRDPYIPPSTRNIPDAERELYVINGLAETISVIDTESREIYDDVLTTGMWPNHLLFFNEQLFLVNSGDNEIVVYDETSFEEVGSVYLGSGSNPWMIIHEEGTNKGYVPNFAAGDVSVVDLKKLTELKRIDVGKGPEGGAYLDGKVYVCNTAWDYQTFDFGEGTVSVIDTDKGKVIETITVGENPQSAISFPDLDEVHIVCTGKNGGDDSDDGEIYIIDTTDDSVEDVLSIGGSPAWSGYGLERARNIAYLTGVGGLMAYNYQTGEVLHDSSDYIFFGSDAESDFFSGAAVDEREGLIYCCFFSKDRIVVLDLEDYSVKETIEGSDGTQSIFLFEE